MKMKGPFKSILLLAFFAICVFSAFGSLNDVTHSDQAKGVLMQSGDFEPTNVVWGDLDQLGKQDLMLSAFNSAPGWHNVRIGLHASTGDMVHSFLSVNDILPENAKVYGAGYQVWLLYYNP